MHILTKQIFTDCFLKYTWWAISSFGIETLNIFDVCEAISLVRFGNVISVQFEP